MKQYVFIRTYNPAYNRFLLAYFREGGLTSERYLTWREALELSYDLEARGFKYGLARNLDEPVPTTQEWHVQQFHEYARSWQNHPEHPPSYFHALCNIIDLLNKGKLNLARLLELDSEARRYGEKILLHVKDVAHDIYTFYVRWVKRPLRRDLEVRGKYLESGEEKKMLEEGMKRAIVEASERRVHLRMEVIARAKERSLMKYFSDEEHKRYDELRSMEKDKAEIEDKIRNEDKYGAEERIDAEVEHLVRVARTEVQVGHELLRWLEGISKEEILKDLIHVLEKHYDRAKRDTKPEQPYWYTSPYVKLSAYCSERSRDSVVFLHPARGFRVHEDGENGYYNDVFFPDYYVEMLPSNMNLK